MVTLTGLDTHKFKAALEATALVSDLFARHIGPGRFEEWIPDAFRQWRAISISNKYFSTRSSAGTDLAPINPLVDPGGIIASLGELGYRYTVDNEVGYFERVKTPDGNFK
jgi:hypothetical protein